MAAQDIQETDLSMDAADMYREEVFTDRKVGTIRRYTPVTGDGGVDEGRPVSYVGQTQLMTPVGALPLSFEIEAESVTDAASKFAANAKAAVDRAMEELTEMRRQAASSIIVPQGGGGMGGAGGGGKIQLA